MAKRPLKREVKLSAGEAKVLSILRAHREPMTVEEVARAFYKHDFASQYYWREAVGGLLRSLQRKTEFNRADTKVDKQREPGDREVRWSAKGRKVAA